MIGGEIFLAGQRLFQRVDGQVVIAIAEHPLALRRRFPACGLVAERRLDRPRGEEDPAVIIRALGRRWRKVRLREGIGEIAADRSNLRHHLSLVADRRDLPHRVERQVRLLLHGRRIIEDLGLVGLADLLQHPADRLSARHRVRVEDEVGHGSTPCLEQSANYSCSSACSSISSIAFRDRTRISPRPRGPKCSSRCMVGPSRRASAI